MLRTADDVLRRAPWTTSPLEVGRSVRRLAGCVVLFAMLYGATMGAYRAFNWQPQWALQMAYSAVKAPLLLCGSFLMTLPAFFVFATLLGLRDDFPRLLRSVVAGQAALAIVLGSITEAKLRQSLLWSDGSPAIFFNPWFDRDGTGETYWIAPIISWIAIVLILLPLFTYIRKWMRQRAARTPEWQG